MIRSKAVLPLFVLALALVVGAFLFPMKAHGATGGDTAVPVVATSLSGDSLEVRATDDVAVAAVYIDGHRVSTLVDGVATVLLKDYAGAGRQITVYATDTANNRSEPVLIGNPYYQAPVVLPAPSAPVATASAPAASTPATSGPLSASASAATSSEATGLADAVPGADVSAAPLSSSAVPTATDTSATDTSDGAPTNGTDAFTPSGGGTVLDTATDEDGKEFFTITTTDGSVYYLIVDRQRGTENVYFLTAVTKGDLTGLAEDADTAMTPELTSPDPTGPIQDEAEQTGPLPEPEQSEEDKDSGTTGTVIFILVAAAAAGAAGYYFKVVRPRGQAADEDDEYDEEEEDEEAADGEGPDGEDYFFEEDEENE